MIVMVDVVSAPTLHVLTSLLPSSVRSLAPLQIEQREEPGPVENQIVHKQ